MRFFSDVPASTVPDRLKVFSCSHFSGIKTFLFSGALPNSAELQKFSCTQKLRKALMSQKVCDFNQAFLFTKSALRAIQSKGCDVCGDVAPLFSILLMFFDAYLQRSKVKSINYKNIP